MSPSAIASPVVESPVIASTTSPATISARAGTKRRRRTAASERRRVAAEHVSHRAAHLAHRAAVLERGADRWQEVAGSARGLAQLLEPALGERCVALGLECRQALELPVLGL